MKKRFLSAGLAVVMAASLTACGGSDSASTTAAAAVSYTHLDVYKRQVWWHPSRPIPPMCAL